VEGPRATERQELLRDVRADDLGEVAPHALEPRTAVSVHREGVGAEADELRRGVRHVSARLAREVRVLDLAPEPACALHRDLPMRDRPRTRDGDLAVRLDRDAVPRHVPARLAEVDG